MRVVVFFDGKNFYAGWRDQAQGRRIDFHRLAQWLTHQVSGTMFWGAYYYTGIEVGEASLTESQRRLEDFLQMLEKTPGYFVRRLPRRSESFHCVHCNSETRYTTEKELDTTMVTEMIRLAAVNAFDVMILLSGDADHAPALEGVRALGKQAYVASWGGAGMSRRLQQVAFDHIDLLDGLSEFEIARVTTPSSIPEEPPITPEQLFLDELHRAEEYFGGGGYVGLQYFLTRWKAENLPTDRDVRGRILDNLVESRRVEIYDPGNGERALRCL